MKIQNMSVIFIIVIIPIMLVVSYYIGLQINTITMQNSYDQKLLAATKDAIDAFEINTTEWNSEYSLVSDSKRRDVLASINTFTQSLANSIGMSGATSQEILNYIPAVGYTLYDGFYIYSSTEVPETILDQNGLTVTYSSTDEKINYYSIGNSLLEGTILYKTEDGVSSEGTYTEEETTVNFTTKKEDAKKTCEYTLSPYTAYTEQLGKYVINYTMDNYLKVYNIETGITKHGFLSVIDDENKGIKMSDDNSDGSSVSNYFPKKISEIKFKNAIIKPEELTEQICYKDEGEYKKKTYIYIYDKDNEKLYYDSEYPNTDGTNGAFFRLNDDGEKKYLANVKEGYYTQYEYKKICIPVKNNSGIWEVLKIYQGLNGDRKNTFYRTFAEETDPANFETDKVRLIQVDEVLKYLKELTDKNGNSYTKETLLYTDFSDVNYCVDSYVFSKWVENNLKDEIKVEVEETADVKIFDIHVDTTPETYWVNNPDPESEEYGESVLAKHKREVMKEKIVSALQQSIELSENQELNYEFRLPELAEEDWQQTLSNVSIIAFMQGMPIGLKYYNNYQIATSTINKEFVNPYEIYFGGNGDDYYHRRYCEKATSLSDYIGYRAVDYKVKTRTESADKKTYYYSHDNNTDTSSEMECYDCLINRSSYNPNKDSSKIKEKQYYEALARERYLQKENVIIADIIKFEVTKTADKSKYYYGDIIEYKIEVKNESNTVEDVIITDEFDLGEGIEIQNIFDNNNINVTGNYGIDELDIGNKKITWKTNIPIGEKGIFTIKVKVIGKPGIYNNTAIVTPTIINKPFKSKKVSVKISKAVTVVSSGNMQPYNIVFVLDSSQSMMLPAPPSDDSDENEEEVGDTDTFLDRIKEVLFDNMRCFQVSKAVTSFVTGDETSTYFKDNNLKAIGHDDTQVGAVRFSTVPILGVLGIGSVAWNPMWGERILGGAIKATDRHYSYCKNRRN